MTGHLLELFIEEQTLRVSAENAFRDSVRSCSFALSWFAWLFRMEYTSARWSSDWHLTWTDYSSPIKSANMWLCGNLWQGLSFDHSEWGRGGQMNSRVDWNDMMTTKSSKSCKLRRLSSNQAQTQRGMALTDSLTLPSFQTDSSNVHAPQVNPRSTHRHLFWFQPAFSCPN